MMKIRYYITGLILIISGFLSFSLIAVLNNYYWMNFTYHIFVVLLGFLLICLGIISMIMLLRFEERVKPTQEVDVDLADALEDSSIAYHNIKKKK